MSIEIDLTRSAIRDWSSEDLNILVTLFVNAMISIADSAEDTTDAAAQDEVKRTGPRTRHPAIKKQPELTTKV